MCRGYGVCGGEKVALLARRRLAVAKGSEPNAASTHGLERSPTEVLASGAESVQGSGALGSGEGSGGGGSVEAEAEAASRDSFPKGLTPGESTLASTVAGVVNVLATTPLWVSNLRIKAGKGEGGLLRTLAVIAR